VKPINAKVTNVSASPVCDRITRNTVSGTIAQISTMRFPEAVGAARADQRNRPHPPRSITSTQHCRSVTGAEPAHRVNRTSASTV